MNKETMERNGFWSKLDQRLFDTRTILIFGEISQRLAKDVTEKLLVLSADSKEDIRIVINSQGGHVEAGDTIFDMIQFVQPKIKMLGTGWVASAGALIYLAVPFENRYCLPNTRFLLHQPMGGVGGVASDIKIEANEIIKMRERINKIIAKQTGQPLKKIEKETDRNFWMSAEEAKDYGLVAQVIKSAKEI